MRFLSTSLPAILTMSLAASTVVPAMAEEQKAADSAKQRFQLSALYTRSASLTREEIDPKAVEIGPQPAPAPAPQLVPQSASARAAPPTAPQVQPKAPITDPNNYLEEYNVDWSRWITTQADRWYYTLKVSEEMLGLRFATLRPAQIQFTCYADGTIRDVVLKQSSGVPAYDRLQMQTLLATMPIPRFPSGTQRTSITLCQGWESHPRQPGEEDFQPGSFGKNFPQERVRQWCAGR